MKSELCMWNVSLRLRSNMGRLYVVAFVLFATLGCGNLTSDSQRSDGNNKKSLTPIEVNLELVGGSSMATRWHREERLNGVTSNNLHDLWMNENGTNGWAIGAHGVILHFDGKQWTQSQSASRMILQDLHGIWMNDNGTDGWIVGDKGTLLQYKNSKWNIHQDSNSVTKKRLKSVFVGTNNNQGFAVGEAGEVLELKKGRWKRIPNDALATERDLKSVWVNDDCTEAWAVGDYSNIVHFYEEKWRPVLRSAFKGALHKIVMDETGINGWAVGDSVVYRCLDELWSRHTAPLQPTLRDITDIRLHKNNVEAWGTCTIQLGKDNPALVHWIDGKWVEVKDIKIFSTEWGNPFIDLNALWMNETLTKGYAVGDYGVILEFSNGKWDLQSESKRLTNSKIMSFSMDKSGTVGTAFTQHGERLELKNGQWKLEEKNRSFTFIHSIWVNKERTAGWAFRQNPIFESKLLQLRGGRWREEMFQVEHHYPGRKPFTTNPATLYTNWFNDAGTMGFVAGRKGEFIRFSDGKWKDIPGTKARGNNTINALWSKEDGSRVWAVGKEGSIVTNVDKDWVNVSDVLPEGQLPKSDLNAIAMDQEGKNGWVVGHTKEKTGTILKLGKEWWEEYKGTKQTTAHELHALSMDDNAKTGWACGHNGTLIYCDGEHWNSDAAAHRVTNADLGHIWIHPEGTSGWAFGKYGEIIELVPFKLGAISAKFRPGELVSIKGELELTSVNNYPIAHVALKVIQGGKTSKLRTGKDYELDGLGTDTVTTRFLPAVPALKTTEDLQFEIQISFDGIALPNTRTYKLDTEAIN